MEGSVGVKVEQESAARLVTLDYYLTVKLPNHRCKNVDVVPLVQVRMQKY